MTVDIADISLENINLHYYNNTDNVKQMVQHIKNGGELPDVIVYKDKKNNKYVLADGIHRICTYKQLNINQIKIVFK
jgi:hypothetical protein